MKTRFLTGLLLLAVGFITYSCDEDDDYTISTTPLVSSIQTGTAEVTAVTAVTSGSVTGLSGLSSSAYAGGVFYSTSQDPATTGINVKGSVSDGTITTKLSDLETNVTYYYCSYVTLQGKVTYISDEVKSFTTTNAVVNTAEAIELTAASATLGATLVGLDGLTATEIGCGYKLGNSEDVESLKEGYDVASVLTSNTAFNLTQTGLLPSTTYYYLPYIKLGNGYVYGDVKRFMTDAGAEPEFVDLGLSVMWASCNVGALQPEGQGGLFGWGELTGLQTSEDLDDYGKADNIFASSADICFANGLGRLPSADEVKELVNNCTSEWTMVNGVSGMRFTATNGNSIFMPAAGYREGTTVSGAAVEGCYWSGSIDGGNTSFGQTLAFNSYSANNETALRYRSLSVRGVKKASAPFDKSLLYNTWYLDLDASGQSYYFYGPLYYYGTDDNWTSISDQDVCTGDSWSWCPVWADNKWICDAADFGTMTLAEDGTVKIEDLTNGTNYEGTYTVDETNRTITLTNAKLLHMSSMDAAASNWSLDLKILSLTEKSVQIATLRDADPCLLSCNFITAKCKAPVYQGSPAYLSYAASGWSPSSWGSADNWGNADVIGDGTYTVKIDNIGGDCTGAVVFVIDIFGYATKLGDNLSKQVATIDKILLDGTTELAVDNSKIVYGDLEGNGNYRIEIYNDYGSTANDSPIDLSNLNFSTSIEVLFTLSGVGE